MTPGTGQEFITRALALYNQRGYVPNRYGNGGSCVAAIRQEESWQIKAACRGPQSVVFFPPTQYENRSERLEREARAKAICNECGVRKACLEYALRIREQHGIWGCLSESERRHLMNR